MNIIMKYLEGRKEGRKNEGGNEHHYEIFRFRREEGRNRKAGMSIIMKYLEGWKEE